MNRTNDSDASSNDYEGRNQDDSGSSLSIDLEESEASRDLGTLPSGRSRKSGEVGSKSSSLDNHDLTIGNVGIGMLSCLLVGRVVG